VIAYRHVNRLTLQRFRIAVRGKRIRLPALVLGRERS
jgi:hypothetical protein